MCHSRENNWKINRLHERYLRTEYKDKQSAINELFEKIFMSRSMNEISKFYLLKCIKSAMVSQRSS